MEHSTATAGDDVGEARTTRLLAAAGLLVALLLAGASVSSVQPRYDASTMVAGAALLAPLLAVDELAALASVREAFADSTWLRVVLMVPLAFVLPDVMAGAADFWVGAGTAFAAAALVAQAALLSAER